MLRSMISTPPQPGSLASTTMLSALRILRCARMSPCVAAIFGAQEKLGFLRPGSEQRLYSQARVRRVPRILLRLRLGATTRLAWGLR
jgi:hypothetical protein